jgi:HlyD family secretion protein
MRRHLVCPALGALLSALLAACNPTPPAGWSGYAEGEPLYIASAVAGRLSELPVRSGELVKPAQALFSLDASLESASAQEAASKLAALQAQARNTDKGHRSEELAVIEAQLRQGRSQAELARSDLVRQQQLLAQGFVARARVDDATLTLQQAQARVAELEASLRSNRLPAREDERSAARAQADAGRAAQAQVSWREQQLQQRAPQAGRITDIFYRPGEWVAAGQPVLSLLPPAQRKARFFVPEADLGRLSLGAAVSLRCDGCGAPIAARVSFIAPQAEYTPPVIYSNEQRAKLVFLIEARPVKSEDAERLHPGQPLDVRLAAP